jgi:hypothetical protein
VGLSGPHPVRSGLLGGGVEQVRDRVEVVTEQARVDVECAAEACPSIRCTAFTLAPAATGRLAAVWRRSWGVTPSSPHALTARSQ